MDIKSLIDEAEKLHKAKKYNEAIKKLDEALSKTKNDNDNTYDYIEALSHIGRFYFKIAKELKKTSEKIITYKKSIKSYKKQLKLIEKNREKDKLIYQEIDSNLFIGINYRAIPVKDKKISLLKAISFLNKALKLSEKLDNTKEKITIQHKTIAWLSICYIKTSIENKDDKSSEEQYKLFQNHLINFTKLTSQAEKGKEREKDLFLVIKKIYLKATSKKQRSFVDYRDLYLKIKKDEIKKKLFSGKDYDLISPISTILAVLNITPDELKEVPLAHYTSPSVCNKLFNIQSDEREGKDKNPPPIRIGSSTYMNDPSEGKGLLELLNIPEWELENKTDCSPYNAFFTCFSSRVNDLNQFRLYGKEDGVEASGCCLVFNKKGNWLKEPDIFSSFLGIAEKADLSLDRELDQSIGNEKLPLYQVAYIAYKDEYISDENFDIWLPDKNNPKFGIRLKLLGKNKNWHNFRIQKLENALHELIKYFKNKTTIKDNEKIALEYIRYLFKDFAFRDEEEFRVLKIVKMDSEEIKYCETTNSIYLPYTKAQDIVDEVILGTNYEKTNSKRKIEVFQHLMKKECSNVTVSRSSLPIHANPPIGKN